MVVRPGGRMHRDNHPVDQPDGTYRYALNAVVETTEGDLNFLSNELGFSPCSSIPYFPIGYVYMGDNTVLVFSTDDVNSEIGILDENCNYTTAFNNTCLNFNKRYPVQATYKLRNGCERTIYFTDGVNPVRVINLDQTYTDCVDIDLVQGYNVPCFIEKRVNNFGGALRIGSYEFAIRYSYGQGSNTPWLYTSRAVHIYEAAIENWRSIVGGYDAEEVDLVSGAPTTTKSITLFFDGLDTNFDFYQIGVIARNVGNGEVSEVIVSPPIPITTQVYNYNGSVEGFTIEPLESIQIRPLSIATAKHIEQLENRLVLANVEGKRIDLVQLQRSASKIKTTFHFKEVYAEATVEGNPKFPTTDDLGYMGDEVYAFGIVYVYKDGYESPVMHIPGRPANEYDLQTFQVVTDFTFEQTPDAALTMVPISEVDFLAGVTVGSSVERYKFENTATLDGNLMGFYQVDNLYPDILDCNGGSIWGEDYEGNQLAGSPIRHHRFPDRRLVGVSKLVQQGSGIDSFFTTRIVPLGVKFDNIDYPSDDIIGHYIVRSDRTFGNKTVLDAGLVNVIGRNVSVSPDVNENELVTYNLFTQGALRRDFQYFIGPETYVNGFMPAGSYYKFERIKNGALQTRTEQYDAEDPAILEVIARWVNTFADPGEAPLTKNRSILSRERVGPAQTITVSTPFGLNPQQDLTNYITNSPMYVTNTRYDIADASIMERTTFMYAKLKSPVQIYTQLESIKYLRVHDCVRTNTEEDSIYWGGDTYISQLNPLVIRSRGILGDILSRPRFRADAEALLGFYVESTINLALRHDISADCSKFIRQTDDIVPTTLNAVATKDLLNDKYNIRGQICEYPWEVNPDFSVVGDTDSYFPLPQNFDYCSNCVEKYPNRIIYSQQSFQEERADNYKVFLTNNYRDIEGEFGEITAIVRNQNALTIFTSDAVFLLPYSYQERVSEDGIVTFIGSGEFFSQPPQILVDSESGGSGTQDKWSIRKTEQGIFYFDTVGKKPILLAGSEIQPLDEGMKSFFEENVGENLVSLTGQRFRSPYFNGFNSGYDRRFDRVLLSYRDFSLNDGLRFQGNTNGFVIFQDPTDAIAYNTDTDEFYINERGNAVVIPLTDNRYFCDKSWTASFSLKTSWVSFHSYVPNWYINTKSNVFVSNDTNLMKMNSGPFQTYFGTKYPHVIEIVNKVDELRSGITESITVQSYATKDGYDQHHEFFNKALFYNSIESTGEKNINISGTLHGSNLLIDRVASTNGISATRRRRNWNINGFRPESNENVALFTYKCPNFRFTDKVVNSDAFSLSVDWHRLSRFDDKYLMVRLILDDPEGEKNFKITTNYIINNNNPTE